MMALAVSLIVVKGMPNGSQAVPASPAAEGSGVPRCYVLLSQSSVRFGRRTRAGALARAPASRRALRGIADLLGGHRKAPAHLVDERHERMGSCHHRPRVAEQRDVLGRQ
jgi:hypothetical protein